MNTCTTFWHYFRPNDEHEMQGDTPAYKYWYVNSMPMQKNAHASNIIAALGTNASMQYRANQEKIFDYIQSEQNGDYEVEIRFNELAGHGNTQNAFERIRRFCMTAIQERMHNQYPEDEGFIRNQVVQVERTLDTIHDKRAGSGAGAKVADRIRETLFLPLHPMTGNADEAVTSLVSDVRYQLLPPVGIDLENEIIEAQGLGAENRAFVRKNKIWHFDSPYKYRMSVAHEEQLTNPNLLGYLTSFYRLKNRYKFQLNKHFMLDLTEVREHKDRSKLADMPSKWEIELEIVDVASFKHDVYMSDTLDRMIHIILQMVQNTIQPITIDEYATIIREYSSGKEAYLKSAPQVIPLVRDNFADIMHDFYSVTAKADGERYFCFTRLDETLRVEYPVDLQRLEYWKQHNPQAAQAMTDYIAAIMNKPVYRIYFINRGGHVIKTNMATTDVNVLDGELVTKHLGISQYIEYFPFDTIYTILTPGSNGMPRDVRNNDQMTRVRYTYEFVHQIEQSDCVKILPKQFYHPPEGFPPEIILRDSKYFLDHYPMIHVLNDAKRGDLDMSLDNMSYWTWQQGITGIPLDSEDPTVLTFRDLGMYTTINNSPFKIDGLVFTRINAPYGRQRESTDILKWKEGYNTTIDFKIKKIPNPNDVTIETWQLYTHENIRGVPGKCNETLHIHFTTINLPQSLYHTYEYADGAIVEFAYDYDLDQFVPIRTRYDKTFSNPLHVVTSNMLYLENPIPLDVITGINISRIRRFSEFSKYQRGDMVHEFHNWIKGCLLINYAAGITYLLEIGSGRGGDMHKWRKAGVKNIVGIDINVTHIADALARYAALQKENTGNLPVPRIAYFAGDMRKDNVRALIKRQFDFNVISAQFSFHYFFESPAALQNMMKNLTENLVLGGYFIGTVFDGRTVFELLREYKTGERADWRSGKELIFSIQKQYADSVGSIDDLDITGQRIIVNRKGILAEEATAKQQGGIPEFLVNFEAFTELMRINGFELVESAMFGDLYLNWNIKKDTYLLNHDKTFSFLNRYFVFRRIAGTNRGQQSVVMDIQPVISTVSAPVIPAQPITTAPVLAPPKTVPKTVSGKKTVVIKKTMRQPAIVQPIQAEPLIEELEEIIAPPPNVAKKQVKVMKKVTKPTQPTVSTTAKKTTGATKAVKKTTSAAVIPAKQPVRQVKVTGAVAKKTVTKKLVRLGLSPWLLKALTEADITIDPEPFSIQGKFNNEYKPRRIVRNIYAAIDTGHETYEEAAQDVVTAFSKAVKIDKKTAQARLVDSAPNDMQLWTFLTKHYGINIFIIVDATEEVLCTRYNKDAITNLVVIMRDERFYSVKSDGSPAFEGNSPLIVALRKFAPKCFDSLKNTDLE